MNELGFGGRSSFNTEHQPRTVPRAGANTWLVTWGEAGHSTSHGTTEVALRYTAGSRGGPRSACAEIVAKASWLEEGLHRGGFRGSEEAWLQVSVSPRQPQLPMIPACRSPLPPLPAPGQTVRIEKAARQPTHGHPFGKKDTEYPRITPLSPCGPPPSTLAQRERTSPPGTCPSPPNAAASCPRGVRTRRHFQDCDFFSLHGKSKTCQILHPVLWFRAWD